MRRLVLTAPGALELREAPDLVPGPGEIRVAVEAAGICGSDLHGYRGENDRRPAGVVMGHEISGTVDATGAGVDLGWAGRAVAVNPLRSCRRCAECRAGRENRCPTKALVGCTTRLPGGFADHLVVPVHSVVPWPDHLPLAWGVMAEPFAVGLHACDLAAPAGRTVNVIGGGAVGLAVALAARRHGAARVVVAAVGRRRRELMADFGMETVQPGREALPVAEITFDCVAAEATVAEALGATRPGGTVVVVGLARTHTTLPMVPLVHGERVVRGSAQYPAATFVRAVDLLAEDGVDLTRVLSRPYGLRQAPEVFRRLAEGRSRTVRTVIGPRLDVSP